MKTIWIKLLTLTLICSLPAIALGQKQKSRSAERTIVGFISDSNHGLEHPDGADEVVCTLECAKHGEFVLADRDNQLVYQLDKAGQEKAKAYAGKKVKVRGRLAGKTLRVTAIEAA